MSQPITFPLNISIDSYGDENGQMFVTITFSTPFSMQTQKFPLEMVTEDFIQTLSNGIRNAVKKAKRSQTGLVLPNKMG